MTQGPGSQSHGAKEGPRGERYRQWRPGRNAGESESPGHTREEWQLCAATKSWTAALTGVEKWSPRVVQNSRLQKSAFVEKVATKHGFLGAGVRRLPLRTDDLGDSIPASDWCQFLKGKDYTVEGERRARARVGWERKAEGMKPRWTKGPEPRGKLLIQLLTGGPCDGPCKSPVCRGQTWAAETRRRNLNRRSRKAPFPVKSQTVSSVIC